MQLKNAAEFLGTLERGNLAKDWYAEVRKATEELAKHDSATATVTLTVKLKVKGDAVGVEGKIDSKLPKAERKHTTLFIDFDGQLSLSHPAQIDAFAPRREAQDVDSD